ncbi:hypothetical protein J2T14_004540 [Paenibacillus harenae]|nr:hypothetical protein [Paenibacillus harenae]
MSKSAEYAESSDVTNSVTTEQYRWLAQQMRNRPNSRHIARVLFLNSHRLMPAQKKKALR